MTEKEKNSISLVKTDYDDFKDLSFFLEQQRKAEAMLREVEDFKKSFVMSKMVSMAEWVKENPTAELEFFDLPHLSVIFLKDGTPVIYIYGRLKYQGQGFEWFAANSESPYYDHPTHYAGKKIAEKLPKSQKKTLNDFHDYLYYSSGVYYSIQDKCMYIQKYDSKFRKTENVRVEDEETLYITRNVEDYLKPGALKAILATEKQSGYDSYNGYSSVPYDNYDKVYDVKKLVNVEKVNKEMYRRFQAQFDLIRDLYCKNPSIPLKFIKRDECGRHYDFNENENNCVMWKGRPHWVSANPDKVSITTSKDRTKIICEFEDKTEYATYSWPTDGPRKVETRTCQLTYSAKNNELENYKVSYSSYEYQPKRHY